MAWQCVLPLPAPGQQGGQVPIEDEWHAPRPHGIAQSAPSETNIFGDGNAVKLPPQAGAGLQGNMINGRVWVGNNGIVINGGLVAQPSARRTPDGKSSASFPHTVIFQDGNRLRGTIVSLDSERLDLSRPGAQAPIQLPRSEIRRVEFSPRRGVAEGESQGWNFKSEPHEAPGPIHATVKLAGADWLFGDLTSADGETFTLKTGSEGSISIPRAGIEWIWFGTTEAPAFGLDGNLSDLEGWRGPGADSRLEGAAGVLTFGRGAWISHSMPPLPALPRFEVDLGLPAEAEEGARLWLQPFETMGPNSFTTGTMQIGFGPKELSHCWDIDAFQVRKTPIPEKAQTSSATVAYRLFYDGPGGRVIIYRNDQKVAEWSLHGSNPLLENIGSRGIKCICLDRANLRSGMRIANFEVKPWNGSLPEANQPERLGDMLSNGSRTVGKLQAISEKSITFSGQRVALASATFLEFPNKPAPPDCPAARIFFKGMGELSVSEFSIGKDFARCKTSFSPATALRLDTISRVIFPAFPTAGEFRDTLVFKNGDELSGSLASAAPGQSVIWQLKPEHNTQIDQVEVAGVLFAGSQLESRRKETSLIELRGGDLLCADIEEYDGAKLDIHHPLLGSRSIASAKLLRLYPSTDGIYMGSRDPEAWLGKPHAGALGLKAAVSRARNPSVYLDGSYLSRAAPSTANETYRAFAIDAPHLTVPFRRPPGQFEISFNATNLYGSTPEFSLLLGGEDMSSIQISGDPWGHIQAMLSWSVLGQKARFQLLPLADKMTERFTRLNVRVFVKSQPGTADIYLDGAPAAQIGHGSSRDISHESETMPDLGKNVSFQLSPDTLVSEIVVRPWNGELPVPGADEPHVILCNGDVAHGPLRGIADDKYYLQSELGPLALKPETVQEVDFGGEPTPLRAAARVRLQDGSVINLDTFHWLGRTLAAHSPAIGDLILPVGKINELIFDPDPARMPHAITPSATKKSGSGKGAQR